MNPSVKDIDVETLTVGEYTAMETATAVWELLYNLKPKYLKSFALRIKENGSEKSELALPVYQMILFFCEHLQEHVKNDPRLNNAILDAVAKRKAMQMMGVRDMPDPD